MQNLTFASGDRAEHALARQLDIGHLARNNNAMVNKGPYRSFEPRSVDQRHDERPAHAVNINTTAQELAPGEVGQQRCLDANNRKRAAGYQHETTPVPDPGYSSLPASSMIRRIQYLSISLISIHGDR